MARFRAILDPTDRWCVYDEHAGLPAALGSVVLTGLGRDEAVSLSIKLEAISRWAAETPGDQPPRAAAGGRRTTPCRRFGTRSS